nr:MAG: hypothetical protein DIU78_16645 [Pseudomonadota bacterium]
MDAVVAHPVSTESSAAALGATASAPTSAAPEALLGVARPPDGGDPATANAAPATPTEPCDPERNCCRTDADCVALDKVYPCECPPCGKQKRWALNRMGYERHRAKWARARCVKRVCPACSGSYFGTAVCLAGRCTIR